MRSSGEGQREISPVYTEEIVCKEVEYLDLAVRWADVHFFGAFIRRFGCRAIYTNRSGAVREKFGKDSPYRSFKFYGAEDENICPVLAPKCR